MGRPGGLEGTIAAQEPPHIRPWEGGQIYALQGHTEAGLSWKKSDMEVSSLQESHYQSLHNMTK